MAAGDESSVLVQTYTAGFKKLVSTETYGLETMRTALESDEIGMTPAATKVSIQPMGEGTVGSTTASGCRTVTVKNEVETYFGATAFWYNVWTRWCWTRSTQTVYSVSYDDKFVPDDPNFEWVGVIEDDHYFYDFSTDDGHPKSAFLHRQRLP